MTVPHPDTEIDQTAVRKSVPLTADMATAWQLWRRSQKQAAAQVCRSVLAADPACAEARQLMGTLACEQGDHSQAADHFRQAVALEPQRPHHHNNLAVTLLSLGRYAEAAGHLQKALALRPDYHDARSNLGLALYRQGLLREAATCFEEILSAEPAHTAALANLGMTLLARQQHAAAAQAYEKAIAADSDHPDWHGNLGAACMRLARFSKAAECYRRASELDPRNLDYPVSRSIALRADGRLPESIELLEQVFSAAPDHCAAIANLVVGLEYTCQWEKLELYRPLLHQATLDALSKGRTPDEDPMLNIRRSDDIALNQAVSRAWCRDIQLKARRIGLQFSHEGRKLEQDRIHIGYLSNDFRNHPVAHQLFPLFRLHDRRRFRITAFSTGPDDGSVYRREVVRGSDEFVDIQDCGLAEAAQSIFDRNIHILVDLMGYSHHHRLEILALRPSPVQVGYLGFLSTTGAPFIDYLVADPVVAPRNHEAFFDEKLLRLPHCYQMNHAGSVNEFGRFRREEWGLPVKGFVFCCFNSAYKIDRSLFDTWMRILLKIPEAVLWLNGGHPMAASHMAARAGRLGVDPRRLIFADKVPLETHLQRLPLADLALDTLRYNGGATTANALAAGVPVITVMGRHWVSRMTASHLVAAGLQELVFSSVADYERAAAKLARHPETVAALRQRLRNRPAIRPLFDTRGFVRHLESGYRIIWQRYLNGLVPHTIDIPENPLSIAYE